MGFIQKLVRILTAFDQAVLSLTQPAAASMPKFILASNLHFKSLKFQRLNAYKHTKGDQDQFKF